MSNPSTTAPNRSEDEAEEAIDDGQEVTSRWGIDVFQSVAGRVSGRRVRADVSYNVARIKPWLKENRPIFPEEVLFRASGAGAELGDQTEVYWANESLLDCSSSEQQKQKQKKKKLPGSDLLKAVHAYAADFYGRATADRGRHDLRSLNETALLAFGILLEEAAEAMLGETGDLALLEGKDEAEGEGLAESSRARESEGERESANRSGSGNGSKSRSRSQSHVLSSSPESERSRGRKRRRLDSDTDGSA